MGYDSFPVRGGEPEKITYDVRIVGNATVANASIDEGSSQGITLSYSATGIYTLTFSHNPGKFVTFTHGFQAATPGNVKGHDVVADTLDTTNPNAPTMAFNVFNASEAAHALVANEYLCLTLTFQQSGL